VHQPAAHLEAELGRGSEVRRLLASRACTIAPYYLVCLSLKLQLSVQLSAMAGHAGVPEQRWLVNGCYFNVSVYNFPQLCELLIDLAAEISKHIGNCVLHNL
jgi:hypothetical protein